MTDPDDLTRIVRRWIEQGWQDGDPSVVDELHSADFVDHDPGGRSADNRGFKEGIVNLYRAFPDLRAHVEDVVVDVKTGTVAVRWSASGTHTRPYLGAPPTGRRTNFKGIEIVRIKEGRIRERWGEWDGIDLLMQLGRVSI
jgi:steroid delta-isomerase-like uncharacterized protein